MGRTALLARLDQLLIDDRVDRWVVVIGGPGMGKSAALAHWLTLRENAGERVPHHFIRRGEYDWDDPTRLVDSLVAQIEARFPEQREPEADATYTCRITHRGDAAYLAVAVSANTVIAGDTSGRTGSGSGSGIGSRTRRAANRS